MRLNVEEKSPPRYGKYSVARDDGSTPLDDRLAGRLGAVLGLRLAPDEMTLARADRDALGAGLLRTLTEAGRGERLLAPADVYRVVPRRTWIRRKAEGGLTNAEFDGLYRLVRLQLLAELVFQDPQRASAWLHSPKVRLGDAAPMDFAADSLGYAAVESWLHEIDQGYVA